MKYAPFLLALCLLSPSFACAAARPEARILVALFDSRQEASPRSTLAHRFIEMPANHLGFDVHYADVTQPLPALGDDVAGIIVWLDTGTEVPDADSYLAWLKAAETQGKKLVIIENGGIGDKYRSIPSIYRRWNDVLSYIGLQDDARWSAITYSADIAYLDKDMMNFEHKLKPPLPPLAGIRVLAGGGATSHLRIHINDTGEDESYDMVTTSPRGGFLAPGYVMFMDREEKPEAGQVWYVNPFLFLRESLNVGLTPIPDTTTLDGRRIFYSHIDGDGWNNVSEIPEYQEHNGLSAEVIYKEVLKPYSEFPFDVALITADVDPDCYGVGDSESLARRIFELPNVEPASHTYSHPLFWGFFEHYTPDKEKPLLASYPPKPKEKFSVMQTLTGRPDGSWPAPPPDTQRLHNPSGGIVKANASGAEKRGVNDESVDDILKDYHYTPRSYACSPFDLNQEIAGSVKRINELSPPDKHVRLLQWSGDTSPFEAAVALTRANDLLNINGGDSRFDKEYPSYSFVAPIGLLIGSQRQIYSSNSNEDTYTDLWTDRFYGYRYLQATVKNTDSPIRVSPFNIYFHIFSGEKQASLNALKENLEFARKQNIIAILASDYAAIADGFFSTEIVKTGENQWSVRNRGHLQTLRFDAPGAMTVDYARSKGVIGDRLFQNSLYVALDPAVADVTVTLAHGDARQGKSDDLPATLVQSTWQVSKLHADHGGMSFEAQGYGVGTMVWKPQARGAYLFKIVSGSDKNTSAREIKASTADDGTVTLQVNADASRAPLMIHMGRL